MRGCNKGESTHGLIRTITCVLLLLPTVAEATSSLLKHDGLEVIDKLTKSANPEIKAAASEVMAKVIPLIWSM